MGMDKMDKMSKMGKMAPDLMAKKDVLMALNKIAKQLMTKGVGMDDEEGVAPEQAEDGAIVADLSVKKVKPMVMAMEDDEDSAPGFDGELDVEEEGDDNSEDDEEDSGLAHAALRKLLK